MKRLSDNYSPLPWPSPVKGEGKSGLSDSP
jgi:hypothetical protein